MYSRALWALTKIADQIGQADPEQLAAKLHLFPSTRHLHPATLDLLIRFLVRAKAMHRERPLLINTSGGTRLRRPDLIDMILDRQRTRTRMNQELRHEEFASGS